MESEIDPAVLQAFGPPPPGIDLLERQDGPVIGVAVMSAIFATTALCLRLLARNLQRTGLWFDDYLMCIALIFTYGTLTITIMGAKAGAGRHVWALKPQEIANVFRLLYTYTFIYAGSVCFTKLSILMFYRRLFERGSKWFRYTLGFATFFTLGYLFSVWGVASGICHPVELYWTQFLGATGTCINLDSGFLILTILNMVADFFVLLVPIPEILALQMSSQKKLGVCAIMGLGGLVCAVSGVRIWAFYKFTVELDVVWIQADAFLLSSVEPAFGIVSACLPSLLPLYRRVRARLAGNPSQNHSNLIPPSNPNASNRNGKAYVQFIDEENIKETHSVDDIAMTSIGRGPDEDISIPQNTILVHSEITQCTKSQPLDEDVHA